MDGLSAGAGVLAVISLAIQVGKASQELVHFFNSITDAPREVTRLKDQTSRIYAISTGITNALEHQRKLHGDDAPGSEPICEALKGCLKRLSLVQDVLRKVDGSRYERRSVARYWAQFRFAAKKEDIVEFERQLGLDLMGLNTLMTTNLMHANVSNTIIVLDRLDRANSNPLQQSMTSRTTDIPEVEKPVEHDSLLVTHEDENNQNTTGTTSIGEGIYTVTTSTTTSTSYSTRLLRLSTCSNRTTRMISDATGTRIDRFVTNISIQPTFLSWAMHIQLTRSNFVGPALTLSLTHYLASSFYRESGIKDAVFLQLFWVLKNDQLTDFMAMLNRGAFTMYSMVLSTGMCRASSLLQLSWNCRAKAITAFLVKQGYKLRAEDFRHMMRSELPTELMNISSVQFEFMDYQPYDLIPREQRSMEPKAEYFMETVERFYLRAGEGHYHSPDYLGSLLNILSSRWSDFHTAQEVSKRGHLICSLVRGGAYLHCVDRAGKTALQNIAQSLMPDDENGFPNWLDLLSSCDVDTTRYIYEEARQDPQPFTLMAEQRWQKFYSCMRRRKLVFHPECSGTQRVQAVSWIEPQATAAMLLQEFRIYPDIFLCPRPCTPKKQCAMHGSIERCWPSTVQVTQNRLWELAQMGQSPVLKPETSEQRQAVHIFFTLFEVDGVDMVSGEVRSVNSKESEVSEDESEISEDESEISEDESEVSEDKSEVSEDENLEIADMIDLWPFNNAIHTLCATESKLYGGHQYCIGRHPRYARVYDGDKVRIERRDSWSPDGGGLTCAVCQLYTCQFNHTRFWRKQEQKIEKRKRSAGLGDLRSHVPGAWID